MSSDIPNHLHQAILDKLLHHLRHLPKSISAEPDYYSNVFTAYAPDVEWIELTGTQQGAVNHDLEVIFGDCAHGHIQFKSRRESLEAVVSVLVTFINSQSAEEGLLLKWVEDLIAAAKQACKDAGETVSRTPLLKT
jgi:hypothetical protein